MKRKKQLKELTLKDNFMFGAVMIEEENCKRFLELALGFPIERVDVSKEKSIVYHPEYKGVRLDVYAKDERNTRYNVEMQVASKPELGKRTRYYHSQIDMELLLSTSGNNDWEVSGELVKFLNFVKADLSESETDYEDDFVKKLQESIRRIKSDREMEERFMIFEEMLRDERAEGKAEGKEEGKAEAVLELLEELGDVPESLGSKIATENDLELLTKWLRLAAKANSLNEFLDNM